MATGAPGPGDESLARSEGTTREVAPRATPHAAAADAGGIRRDELLSDRALHGCRTIEFDGALRPFVGRVALLAKVGKGGMGVVYRGVNPRLGTEVAVKVLLWAQDAERDWLVDRFVREARLAARLRSDHLVQVLDVDRDDDSGMHYLVMEFVRGQSAGAWLRGLKATGGQGGPEAAALEIAIAATRGLAVAHLAGIVHRDIKPDNVLIPADPSGRLAFERAKLADLGLARPEGGEASLTGEADILGTPGYMAPEQAEETRRAKKPADVFSMGATLYALLTGKAPFAGASTVEAIFKTLQHPHPPVLSVRPGVSPATAELIEHCLAKDAAQRYPDAPALLEALELCRAALVSGGAAQEAVSLVASFVQRQERGERVKTDPSAGSGDEPPTTQLHAGTASGLQTHGTLAPREGPRTEVRPALLSVASRPPGAEVLVDGTPAGTAPLLAAELAPGRHEVALRLAGHVDANRSVTCEPGATADLGEIALDPWPVLDLSALESDVTAHVAGARCAGRASVPPGDHDVRLTRPGHEDQLLRLRAEAGQTIGVRADPWAPLSGWLDLAALPRDARCTIGDRVVTDGHPLAPGTHTLHVARPGHDAQEITLVVRPGATARAAPGPWVAEPDAAAILADLAAWDAATPARRRAAAESVARREPAFRLQEMQTFASGDQTHEVAVFLHEATGLEFVLVPAGRYRRGSPAGEPGRYPNEAAHDVTLTRPFLLARTPCTQAAWERIAGTNPSKFPKETHPVEQVSWDEAAEFCERAGLELPTEAQWEHACRAGTTTAYSFGDDVAALPLHAWTRDNADFRTHPVARRRPNAFGLHDMHGNVWEWCADLYGEYPGDGARDPVGVSSRRERRVFRGGGWYGGAADARSATRGRFEPGFRSDFLGFRPARTVAL